MSASLYLLWEEASPGASTYTAARACACVSVSLCTRLAVSQRPAVCLRGTLAALTGLALGTEQPVKTGPRQATGELSLLPGLLMSSDALEPGSHHWTC